MTISSNTNLHPYLQKLLMLLSIIGPGLITANIDNDAGGIATYSMAGAQTGYRLLWILFPITTALIIVQEMSARMGIVSGKGLADMIREKYGLKVTFYTFIFLILADLGNTTAEFAGIAASSELFGISKYITVPICGLFVWLLILKGDYKIVERVFLLGCTIYISYIICGIIVDPPWKEVLTSMVVPNVSGVKSSDLPIIVGLIGTSITPWMQFYIQSAVVEKGVSAENLLHSKFDIIAGCICMLTVTIFIIICCAATLYPEGITITSAEDAAKSLEPLAGKYSSALFGIGLFNASIFSAALLPLATSYYICEGMGWESGINKSFREAPHFFSIFTLLILLGMAFILLPGIKLFSILFWTQVVNGILIPLILVYIIQLANDPEFMGEYTNGPFYNIICYLITLLIIIANCSFIYFELTN